MSETYIVNPDFTYMVIHFPQKNVYGFGTIRPGTYLNYASLLNEVMYTLNNLKICSPNVKPSQMNEKSFTTPLSSINTTFTLYYRSALKHQFNIDTNNVMFRIVPCKHCFAVNTCLNTFEVSFTQSQIHLSLSEPGYEFLRSDKDMKIIVTPILQNKNADMKLGVNHNPGTVSRDHFIDYNFYNFVPGEFPLNIFKEDYYYYASFPYMKYFDVEMYTFNDTTYPVSKMTYQTGRPTANHGRSRFTMNPPYICILNQNLVLMVVSNVFKNSLLFNGKQYYMSNRESWFSFKNALDYLKWYLSSIVAKTLVFEPEYDYTITYDNYNAVSAKLFSTGSNHLQLGKDQFTGFLKDYQQLDIDTIEFKLSVPLPSAGKEHHGQFINEHGNHHGVASNMKTMTYYRKLDKSSLKDNSSDFCQVMSSEIKPSYSNGQCQFVHNPPAHYNYATNTSILNDNASSDTVNFKKLQPAFTNAARANCTVAGFRQCDSAVSDGCDDNRCVPKINGTCTADSQCSSGKCVLGNCMTHAYGTPCNTNADCNSGICEYGFCSVDNTLVGQSMKYTRLVRTTSITINGKNIVIPRGEYTLQNLLKLLPVESQIFDNDKYTIIVVKNVSTFVGSAEFNNAIGLLKPTIVYENLLLGLLLKVNDKNASISYVYDINGLSNWGDYKLYYATIVPNYYSIQDLAVTIQYAMNLPFRYTRDTYTASNNKTTDVFTVSFKDNVYTVKSNAKKFLILGGYPRNIYNSTVKIDSLFSWSLFSTQFTDIDYAEKNKIPFVQETTIKIKLPDSIKTSEMCYSDNCLCIGSTCNCGTSCSA